MAIPKYDEMMLPLLRFLEDGTEHAQRELSDRIAAHFKLTPEECAKMLPKVRATYVRHRVGWAVFSLRRAGLAEHPRRGIVCISDEGRKFLEGNPSQLRAADLKAFPAFIAFVRRMKTDTDKGDAKTDAAELVQQETPEERMELAFTELNATLVTELLSRLAKIDPFASNKSFSICSSRWDMAAHSRKRRR